MSVPCRAALTGSAHQAKGRERRDSQHHGDHDANVSAARRVHAAGAGRRPFMTVQRLEHIGIVVDDLAAATAFFAALGLELEGEASVEGGSVDRINGLEGVRADIVMLRTPDGNGKVELAKYRSPSYEGDDGPAPANAPGIRHILFVVDDIEASLAGLRAHGGELVGELVNYENSYWLCYVRGPAGIIVELAEKIS